MLSINKVLRRRTEYVRKEVRKITGKMAEEARKILTQADCLAKKLIPETEKDRKSRGHLLDTARSRSSLNKVKPSMPGIQNQPTVS